MKSTYFIDSYFEKKISFMLMLACLLHLFWLAFLFMLCFCLYMHVILLDLMTLWNYLFAFTCIFPCSLILFYFCFEGIPLNFDLWFYDLHCITYIEFSCMCSCLYGYNHTTTRDQNHLNFFNNLIVLWFMITCNS